MKRVFNTKDMVINKTWFVCVNELWVGIPMHISDTEVHFAAFRGDMEHCYPNGNDMCVSSIEEINDGAYRPLTLIEKDLINMLNDTEDLDQFRLFFGLHQ